jgi:8-oxo-dGTP diphosphatase
MPQMRATLLFIFHDDKVLLIRKKRGLGAGKINGPGGKLDPGETPLECAVRETEEELGVRPENAEEFGILRFQFTDGLGLLCHVFRADAFAGEAIETDEAIPLWTPVAGIPYHEMWADDFHWLPLLAARIKFRGDFEFDGDRMLTCQVMTL